MNADFDVIVKTFPKTQNVLRVYALGDIHIGSENYDERAVKAKIQRIQEDPFAALCLCGDLGDYGLKNSKTNVYKATMQPKEQQRYIRDLFDPVKDKIVAAVPGNHEERIAKEVGTCPLYDLCVLWEIPEVYRENVAIVKLAFGILNGKSPNTFVGIVTHGSSRARHKKFIAGFDGIDFAISWHTHTPEYSPHGKIRVNSQKASASHVPYKEIVVDANVAPGGYALKKEYEIAPPPELQYLELSIEREPNPGRKQHKRMSYHAIQI